ncbi:MAG: GFA family protein, partial [Gammaproteobacteria bacterium]|nr:GFA family protein [Gammaproteobacteria bacterium]
MIACHCTDCQRQSGSAFGMTMVVGESDFRILQGKLKTFTSTSNAGRGKLGAFCPRCGTRIYHKPEVRPLHTARIAPAIL